MSAAKQVVSQINSGDPAVAENLLPLVYDELRRLAAAQLSHERPGQTLQATALVHEAYLRLLGNGERQIWNSRGHFFAAAAEAMRRILVEQARRKNTQRRGGGIKVWPLDELEVEAPAPSVDLLAINEALERLERIEPVVAQLVKLRYYGGLTLPQAAEALRISASTADRYWAYGRAWLHAELAREDARQVR